MRAGGCVIVRRTKAPMTVLRVSTVEPAIICKEGYPQKWGGKSWAYFTDEVAGGAAGLAALDFEPGDSPSVNEAFPGGGYRYPDPGDYCLDVLVTAQLYWPLTAPR